VLKTAKNHLESETKSGNHRFFVRGAGFFTTFINPIGMGAAKWKFLFMVNALNSSFIEMIRTDSKRPVHRHDLLRDLDYLFLLPRDAGPNTGRIGIL
jgi:hypothetical protein